MPETRVDPAAGDRTHPVDPPRRGLLGALGAGLTRWARSDEERAAEDLRLRAVGAGCRPVTSCADRSRAMLRGTVSSVMLQPRAGTPALEAELFDGSGTVLLSWLGRRRIAGIEPGRRLLVEGRISRRDGARIIFNPRYTLLPGHPRE